MKRYVLRPGVHTAFIPGVGKVRPGQVLEGDRYAAFASMLVEILDSTPPAPVSSLTEPRMEMTTEPAPLMEEKKVLTPKKESRKGTKSSDVGKIE